MKIVPVITLCPDHRLDTVLVPYLCRLTRLLMLSYPYAARAEKLPSVPLMIDSGGFASIHPTSKIIPREGHFQLEVDGQLLDPLEVLRFQERHAAIGFTLDFLIPPGLSEGERVRRFNATLQNAEFALRHHQNKGMELYASLQAWDAASAAEAASHYRHLGFTGIGIGGLVPHARKPAYIRSIVQAVKDAAPGVKLHAFGLGSPGNTELLLGLQVDSSDSSSYARNALDGVNWKTGRTTPRPELFEALKIALDNLSLLEELVA